MGSPSEPSSFWDCPGESFYVGAVKKKSSTDFEIVTCLYVILGNYIYDHQ